MTIGIEAERANNPQKTGVEHYAKQIIVHLARIDRENQYILYLRTPPARWFLDLPKNFSLKVMPFPIFWTQLRISWEMVFHPVDVLFIPASALPIIHPKKSVVTIHDLAWVFYPKTFTRLNRWFLEWSTRYAASNASAVIAVSNATKEDLLKYYSVAENKITVVWHGFESSERSEEAGRELPEKYVLFLSTIQPRKNLEGLVEAFCQLKKQNPKLPHKLLVVGKPGWKYQSSLRLMEERNEEVVYLNYVPDKQRLSIMRGADLLVLPSFYEGFGMQILEAFDSGVPVATSNVSSMPEVAGEAAIYFEPKDVWDIKRAVQNVLLDKSLAERLRKKGKVRIKNFGWEKCARETLEVLKSA